MSHLGNKHTCPKCHTKFYDMGAKEVVCPVCACELKQTAPINEYSELNMIQDPEEIKSTGTNDNYSVEEILPRDDYGEERRE